MKKQEQNAKALEEHLRFESLLREISDHIINLPFESMDIFIDFSIRKLSEFYDADLCHLGMFSAERNRFIVSHFYSKPEITIPQTKEVGNDFLSFIYSQLRKKQDIIIENFNDLPKEAHVEREYFKVF